MIKKCDICSSEFKARNRKNRGYKVQKFCSMKCYRVSRKGVRVSIGTEFKNGDIPFNKGMEMPESHKKKLSRSQKRAFNK